MNERIQDWLSLEPLADLLQLSSAAYFVLALVLVFVSRWLKAVISRIDLTQELTTRDNKALSLETAGYFLAVMITIASTYRSSPAEAGETLVSDLLDSALWSLIAIVLLLLSGWINDRFLLRRFNNRKELIEDRNVGTGAVIAGTYLGTGLIVSASLQGTTGGSFGLEILDTLIFFVIGQLAFILLGLLYQMTCRYDVHDEIEKDSAAAGVAFGMNLLAVAMILAAKISASDSLVALAAWAVIAVILLMLGRLLVDRFLLPGSSLDDEIARDRNWGAALIEGSAALGIAFLLNASFI